MARLSISYRAAMSTMLVSATLFSCINPEYDLSKGIDTDVTLLKNTTIPLGNIASIPVSDLFGGEDSSFVSIDKNGDLFFSFGAGESVTAFDMPSLDMGGDGGFSSGKTTVHFNTGVDTDKVPDVSDEEIHFSGTDQSDQNGDKLLDTYMDIEIDKEVPKEIKDIKVVNMDKAILEYNFKVSEGGILHLKDGFKMEFPHYMVLEKYDDTDDFTLIDGYIVIFNKDMMVTSDQPLSMRFRFKSVHGHEYDAQGNPVADLLKLEPLFDDEGNKKATRLYHTDRLDITGDLYLKYRDYQEADMPIPSEIYLYMNVDMFHLEMTSAELQLDMDMSLDPQTLELSDSTGDMFGDDVVLDLYNPAIILSLNNSSPLEMNINADITSFADSKYRTLHLGDSGDCPTDPLIIPSDDQRDYFISARGKLSNTGDIKLPELAEMLKEMPDRIEIHNLRIKPEDKFVNVYADSRFEFSFAYEFSSPLAFGEDLKLAFSYDVELGEESSVMNSLVLSFEMINTIPLDLNITGVALDSEGKEIADADVDLNLIILGGDLDNPTVTPLELSINSDSVPVTKFRLNFHASVSPEKAGELLNVAQSLDLTNLAITLPDGITLDLNTNEEN